MGTQTLGNRNLNTTTMKKEIIQPTEKYPIPNPVMVAQKTGSYMQMTSKQRKDLAPYIKKLHWKQEHYDQGPAWLETTIKVWDTFWDIEAALTIPYSEAWIKVSAAEEVAKNFNVKFETH
jgi:hypothetical protein